MRGLKEDKTGHGGPLGKRCGLQARVDGPLWEDGKEMAGSSAFKACFGRSEI